MKLTSVSGYPYEDESDEDIIVPDMCTGCMSLKTDENDSYAACVKDLKCYQRYEHCPCIDCILKVICHHECESFTDFRTNIRNGRI